PKSPILSWVAEAGGWLLVLIIVADGLFKTRVRSGRKRAIRSWARSAMIASFIVQTLHFLTFMVNGSANAVIKPTLFYTIAAVLVLSVMMQAYFATGQLKTLSESIFFRLDDEIRRRGYVSAIASLVHGTSFWFPM